MGDKEEGRQLEKFVVLIRIRIRISVFRARLVILIKT